MLLAFVTATIWVVLAEMGDKTQLLAMAFATRYRWQTVMWAVFAATLVNHFLAVVAGNFITSLIPMEWIKLTAAVSFVLFGLWTIHGDQLHGEENRQGRSPFWTVAVAFFIAEMGDKTQLMTVALAANQAAKIGGTGLAAKAMQIIPVWMGTTCGMLVADAIGILVGIVMHKHIPEKTVKWLAAVCFILFGLWGLHEAFDHFFKNPALHHVLLLASLPVIGLGMVWLSRQSGRSAA